MAMLHGVALGVGPGSGADPHGVGGLHVLARRAPAGGEAAHAPGPLRPGQFQAVVAPAQAPGDPRGPARADSQRAARHHHVAAGPAPLPFAVLLEPVVVPALADQAPAHRRRRHAPAGGVHGDDVEAHRRGAIGRRRALVDLDAQIERPGAHLQRHPLAHRPAARLEHRGGDRRDQGIGRVAGHAGRQRQVGAALAVGDRLAQFDELLGEGLDLVAPLIVGELGEGVGVGAQARLALGGEAGAGRAVEEAGGHVHGAGLARRHRDLRPAAGGHRQALGNEILHREGELAGRLVIALDVQFGAPVAARRGLGQIDIGQHRPALGAREGVALELHPRGPLDHDVARPVVHRLGIAVAGQGAQVGALAGPIDAPIAVEIAVDGGAGGAAGGEVFGGAGGSRPPTPCFERSTGERSRSSTARSPRAP